MTPFALLLFFLLEFLYPPFSLPIRSWLPSHWSQHVSCWRGHKEGPGWRIAARISFADLYLCVAFIILSPQFFILLSYLTLICVSSKERVCCT